VLYDVDKFLYIPLLIIDRDLLIEVTIITYLSIYLSIITTSLE
jgi:hypothetical protein